MRFLMITMMFMMSGSVAKAAVKNFNGLIQEASLSEKLLRRKLLKALQNTEVAIVSADKREQLQRSYPQQDFQVRLVKER